MTPAASIRGYRLLERIGTGAGSVIYRAKAAATGKVVAIKHVSSEGRENAKCLRHARNEYRVLRSLKDGRNGSPPEGIVTVHDLLRSWVPGRRKDVALVMEYVDGLDLRRERRYPMGQLVDILSQVTMSIAAIHAKGYIHGDIKPENIVVNHSGRATVIDFGFSCRAGSQAKTIRGTRDYMAPEQVDKGQLTERTDIYNFGATMYFLLTGRHVPALMPAQGDSSHFITSRKYAPPSPDSLNPAVPGVLDTMVLRCVEREMLRRPSCMEEVQEALAQARERYVS